MIYEFKNICVTCNVTHKDCFSLVLASCPERLLTTALERLRSMVFVSYLLHTTALKGLSWQKRLSISKISNAKASVRRVMSVRTAHGVT